MYCWTPDKPDPFQIVNLICMMIQMLCDNNINNNVTVTEKKKNFVAPQGSKEAGSEAPVGTPELYIANSCVAPVKSKPHYSVSVYHYCWKDRTSSKGGNNRHSRDVKISLPSGPHSATATHLLFMTQLCM